MKSYFVTHTIMDKKIGALGSVATAITLSLSPVSAEALSVKEACKTSLECAKLSNSLQAQINKLENSDDPDFDKLDKLQEQLIITKDSTIAIENNKQENQTNSIEAIDKTDKKIEELRGALL